MSNKTFSFKTAKTLRAGILLLAAAVFMTGLFLFPPESTAEAEEIVIYSSRREQFVRPILNKFEEETGIDVQLLSGDEAQFNLRLKEEANNPRADVFLANDAGVMEDLRDEGILESGPEFVQEEINSEMRAPDASWFGLSARTRILMYNEELMDEEDLPESITDLTDSRFEGDFALTRPGNGSMISHMAGLRLKHGDEWTQDFIEGLMDNDPHIVDGHTDIRRSVGRGEVSLGLVNNYYYRLQLEEERHDNVGAVYPDQGQDEMGIFVNVAGAALKEGGPNPEAREELIEFLLQEDVMIEYAETSLETPLVEGFEGYEKSIEDFEHMDIDLSEIGGYWQDTLDLMERAGYYY